MGDLWVNKRQSNKVDQHLFIMNGCLWTGAAFPSPLLPLLPPLPSRPKVGSDKFDRFEFSIQKESAINMRREVLDAASVSSSMEG